MGRAKRDAHAFTMKMDSATYERLEKYCKDSGQTKTVAVERAIECLYLRMREGTGNSEAT